MENAEELDFDNAGKMNSINLHTSLCLEQKEI